VVAAAAMVGKVLVGARLRGTSEIPKAILVQLRRELLREALGRQPWHVLKKMTFDY
jgi:hypothetical protein